jgi:hypothetical protein
MTHSQVLLFLLFLASFVVICSCDSGQAADPAVEEGDYTFYYGKAEAGGAHYSIKQAGEKNLEVITDSTLHAAFRRDQKVEFHQVFKAIVDSTSASPLTYGIHTQSPFKEEDTSIDFNATEARIKRTTSGTAVSGSLTYDHIPPVVDYQNPGGGNWNIPLLELVLRKEALCTKRSLTLRSFYTGTFQMITITFERIEGDTGTSTLTYRMCESTEGEKNYHYLTFDGHNGSLLKMESPATHFTYLRKKGGKVATPPDISGAYSVPLPMDMRNCGEVKGRIKVQLLQEPGTLKALERANQTFSGTFEKGVLEGTFQTKSINHKSLSSPPFPFTFGEEAPKNSRVEEFLIESEDREIRNMAENLTRNARTLKEAVAIMGKWVFEEVKFGFTDGSAKATLVSRKGDWLPRNRLFISFCRSLGIPARMVCGYLLTQNTAGNFIWSEVYMGPQLQWIPIDTALGQIDYFSANYINLCNQGFVDPFSLRPVIEIIEHREEPRPRGTKFVVE